MTGGTCDPPPPPTKPRAGGVAPVKKRRAQTHEEELRLAREIPTASPERAAEIRWGFVLQWEDAARQVARRFLPVAGGCPLEDLEQAARLGLHRAAEGFDPERGFRFSTYARWWVRASMQQAVARHRLGRGVESFPPPPHSEEDGEPMALLERLGQPPQAEEQVQREEMAGLLWVALEEADLDPQEREILLLHLHEARPSLRTLAQRWKCSPRRAGQIERSALAKVRETLEGWGVSLH